MKVTLSLTRGTVCLLVLFLLSLSTLNAQNWYLPDTAAGPAVNAANPPEGYVIANFCCVQAIVDADPFCLDTNWDTFCQADYSGCVGDCSNPAACNYSPFALDCDASFFGNAFTCKFEKWHIPETPSSGVPAVFSCEAPEGYITPQDQCCLEHIISVDSYCVDTTWDSLCQTKLEGCEDGCLDEEACNYSEYAVCNTGIFGFLACQFEHWYLPNEGASGPAYFGCEPPVDYYQAEDCCVQSIVDTDPFCLVNNWDGLCVQAYNLCLTGCDDPAACNYNENAICNLQGCDYPEWYLPEIGSSLMPQQLCEPEAGYFLADPECFNFISGYCSTQPWTGICLESYLECKYYYGCTDVNSCNYNAISIVNDGTCEGFRGCTNSDSSNYNPLATCDDGSCELTIIGGCLGDFNADGFVTTADLSGFLAVFGTACAP